MKRRYGVTGLGMTEAAREDLTEALARGEGTWHQRAQFLLEECEAPVVESRRTTLAGPARSSCSHYVGCPRGGRYAPSASERFKADARWLDHERSSTEFTTYRSKR